MRLVASLAALLAAAHARAPVIASGRSAGASGPASTGSAPVELFTAYTGWPTCYRQPFLVVTPTALLAFVEGRPGISYCSGTTWPDTPDFPILLRRSLDGGASWGSVVNVTRGDLDFLTAVYDSVVDRVILLVQQGDSGVIKLVSSDAGLTWSPPEVVPLAVSGFASIIPGVGHGLQIDAARCLDPSCFGLAGRLVMPFVATRVGPVSNDTACGTCATALVVSDDHGETWSLAAVSEQNGSREAALVQLDSSAFGTLGAVIFATERNLGNATGTRLHAISTDGGRTFGRVGSDLSLPDVVTGNWTGVVAGLVAFRHSASASPVLVFSAPAAEGQRANLSMWQSRDNGATWAGMGTIWQGPAAYSDLVQIDAQRVGLVFEGGADEFAEGVFFAAFQPGA